MHVLLKLPALTLKMRPMHESNRINRDATTQQTNGLGFAWDIESHSRIQSILSRVDLNFRNLPRSGLGATPPLTQS